MTYGDAPGPTPAVLPSEVVGPLVTAEPRPVPWAGPTGELVSTPENPGTVLGGAKLIVVVSVPTWPGAPRPPTDSVITVVVGLVGLTVMVGRVGFVGGELGVVIDAAGAFEEA